MKIYNQFLPSWCNAIQCTVAMTKRQTIKEYKFVLFLQQTHGYFKFNGTFSERRTERPVQLIQYDYSVEQYSCYSMTIARITSDFADRVGGDGFSDIKRARTCCGKTLWLTLFCLSWGMVSYQVYEHITTYLQYPIDTKVQLQFDEAAIFPSISFCNLNPVKWQVISKPEANLPKSLLDILRPKPAKNSSHDMLKRGDWDDEISRIKMLPPELEDNDLNWSPEDHPEEIQIKNQFYNYYFNQPNIKKQSMGHQIEDMLTECVWQEKQCYPSNFTHYLHPEFGNCYAFNAGWISETKQNKTILKAHLPGPSDGLSLTLFVESMEYIPLISDSTGVRVHIHGQEMPPHPEDTGFTVSAGFASALELRKVELNRLPYPYNSVDCKTWFEFYENDIRVFWPRANYSMITCMKLCYQQYLVQNCNCVESTSYYLNNSRGNEEPCSIQDNTQGLCAQKFDINFRLGSVGDMCRSRCPQGCSESTFEVQYSSAVWPNDYYEDILMETMDSRSGHIQEENKHSGKPGMGPRDTSYVKDNMLKISVYFQSLNYKMISEEAAYVLVNMLANLGGSVDLWVGMSVLAMVQCVEYFLEILIYICCKSLPPNHATKTGINNDVHYIHTDKQNDNQPNMYKHGANDFNSSPPLT